MSPLIQDGEKTSQSKLKELNQRNIAYVNAEMK